MTNILTGGGDNLLLKQQWMLDLTSCEESYNVGYFEAFKGLFAALSGKGRAKSL